MAATQFFSVGLPEIDEEHQVLFDCLDAIVFALDTSYATSQGFAALEKLTDYSRTHFRVEECLMRVFDDPGLDEHKQQHAYFIEELEALRAKILSEDVSTAMVNFLTEWLRDHIRHIDLKYVEFCKQKGGPAFTQAV